MIVCHRLPRTTKLSPFRESIVAKILAISLALRVSCDPFKTERAVLMKMYTFASGFWRDTGADRHLCAAKESMVHAHLKEFAEQAATFHRTLHGPAVTQMDRLGDALEAYIFAAFA